MIIYSEHGKVIGATRKSPCGCMTQLVIQGEPWRTMLANTLTDYALVSHFEPHTYRLDATDVEGRWLVAAKSTLEADLSVNVAEVTLNAEGQAVLSLLRIRPQYTAKRRSRREKRQTN